MPTNTYTALVSTTLSTSTSSIDLDLTGITGYTDLVLSISARSNAGYPETSGFIYVGNGSIDTGNNYSQNRLLGLGSSVTSGRQTNRSGTSWDAIPGASSTSGNFCATIIHLNNYSNTTTYKTFLIRSNEPNNYVEATAGVWNSTSAINKIRILADAGSLVAGTTVTVYGITAWAPESTPKATGGYVTSDSTYWYHSFPFSGTFTPNQSLSVDYLVVAGGGSGGGGSGGAGGGGAGGLLTAAAYGVTATNYTVTVGAGGAGVGQNLNGNAGSNSVFGSITAIGGGRGALEGYAGGNGGCGGGASYSGQAGGTGTAGQGGNGGGGAATGSPYPGHGGGGKSDGGQNASGGNGGAGGAGLVSDYSGTSVTYAGGGGGGTRQYNGGGAGGSGVGGTGAGGTVGGSPAIAATAGAISTGSGGGGANDTGGSNSGNGGSGIVIIRYLKA